jgi:hypothetical protein
MAKYKTYDVNVKLVVNLSTKIVADNEETVRFIIARLPPESLLKQATDTETETEVTSITQA